VTKKELVKIHVDLFSRVDDIVDSLKDSLDELKMISRDLENLPDAEDIEDDEPTE